MGRPNFGHIERLGHDHYRLFWGKGYRPDGKRDRHTATIHGTRQEAEIFLARQIGVKTPKQTTWNEFFAVYVEPSFEGLAKRTVDDYHKLWDKYLKPNIGTWKVCETDEDFVDITLAKISAPSTQRHVKDLWRKACRIAVRKKFLDRCPISADTPLKPLRATQKRLLDASEVHTWLDKLQGFKHELALLVMLGGGLRPEEAYGLHYEDFEQWGDYLVVRVERALTYSNGKVLKETKNGFSEREVVLGLPFAERAAFLSKRGGIVCKSGRLGSPLELYASPHTIGTNYRLWCERKNAPYVQPRYLRSSFATMHGEAGSPDSLVSGAMGHSDGTTKSKHYQQITRRGLALIADNLAEYLRAFEQDK